MQLSLVGYHGSISGLCDHTQKLLENCIYALAATRKETGCTRMSAAKNLTRSTFSESVTVSIGVSKLGPVDLIFIDATVKINGTYYCEVLLTQKLLPVMCEICGEFFIFQQGNLPAH